MDIRNLNVQLQGTRPPMPLQPDGKAPRRATATSAAGDRVEISADARHAAIVGALVHQALHLPETRPEAVEAARLALLRGYLDTPAAFDATAEAMLRAD